MILKAKPIKGKPLVTAILPATNEERYIGKAIQSLLDQSYKPIEVIAIDNSSIDNTWDVIKNFKSKIKAVRLTGFQKGPGKAWNHGAKISKGKILMLGGGDLLYGKNYIKDMIEPILKGKTIGTMHYEEKIANLDSLWSRAFAKVRCYGGKTDRAFLLIRKDSFFKYGPIDTNLGYADDKTFNKKHGLESLSVKTDIWHHNPYTFIETWKHDVWIGKSFKSPTKTILMLPLFPFFAIYKSIEHLAKKDFYWKFLLFLPVFYSLRYFAYFVGAIKKLKE